MPSITNVQTGDGYTNAATLKLSQPTDALTTVSFAITGITGSGPLYFQFILIDPRSPQSHHIEAWDWAPEERMMPAGNWTWTSSKDFDGQLIGGVRAKNYTAGGTSRLSVLA